MKKNEDFKVDWLTGVKDDFESALSDVIIAVDQEREFVDQCGELIWDINNNRSETINLVQAAVRRL